MNNQTNYTPDPAATPDFPLCIIDPQKIKNGIIVRSPNWLGDAIMTLPALMQIKKIIPQYCGLFVICPPGLESLYKCLPFVNLAVTLHSAHENWNGKDFKKVLKLRAGIGILFNNSFRDAFFLRLTGVARLYGASARFRSILLQRSFKFQRRRAGILNSPHHALKYLSIVKALGAPEWHGELPEFNIPITTEELNHEALQAYQTPRLVALAAGAAYGGSKRWNADCFNAVARWWITARDGGIAVLGSTAERAIAAQVLSGLPSERTFNLAGKTSMFELMHLLKQATLCVANDSGIMHLAAALGKPGIAIFGPTDPAATSPLSARWRIMYEKLPCSPCFKRECPNGQAICMEKITPEQVIAAITALIPEK